MDVEKLTRNQAIKLLGVFTLTDGYLFIDEKVSRWGLETTPNQMLHNICRSLFFRTFGIKINTLSTKGGRYMRTELFGKKYRTPLSEIQNIVKNNFEFLKKQNLDMKILAFRLAMDLEGSICMRFSVKRKFYKDSKYFQFQFEPELKMSFANKVNIEDWIEITKDIGFVFTREIDERRKEKVGGLRTSDRKQIVKFYEDVGGFLTDVKVSKSPKIRTCNNGFSKQDILKTIIFILKNHERDLSKNFNSKNEAEDYREKFIETIFIPTRNYMASGLARI